MTAPKKIKVTLIRSLAKKLPMHKNNANGLGLRKMHRSVVIDATPENMGMVNKSSHMFRVEEV
ncbi:MAG TPA: 50S ribosomal protein L30 [Solimonas sp.]|nr:50S ribosomal protein L30 [Solimonas sp.]